MTRTANRILPIALGIVVTASCRPDGPGFQETADATPFTTSLACPDIGGVPFELTDTDWMFDDNEARTESQPRHKHQPSDVMGNPAVGYALTQNPGDDPLIAGNEILSGIMARTELERGLFAAAVIGELVSLWQYDDASDWQNLGEQRTADISAAVPGAYSFELDSPPSEGVTIRYAVLQPEPSCGAHHSYNLAAGTKVVFTDIDGTMTLSDDELIVQVGDFDHDPAQKTGSVALTQAWADKGYQMVYLTARPHLFRSETRKWLEQHGYADGPVITAPDLVFGESARMYKRAWVNRVRNELQWDVVAAYGNATSDIDAYEDAGIDKGVTFIIGPNAGVAGTSAIDNDDYTPHIADYVTQQPDA
jgi:hypothetical protein